MKIITLALLFSSTAIFAQTNTQPSPAPQPPPSASSATVAAVYPNAPVIEFESTVHDFGTLKRGSPVNCKFKYKNTGKEPLIIYNCKAGCGCTTPTCSKDPVKPGKTGFIQVHYDSMRVGVFVKEIMVTSNAKNGVVNLVIKGTMVGEAEGTDPAAPAKPTDDPAKKSDIKHNE